MLIQSSLERRVSSPSERQRKGGREGGREGEVGAGCVRYGAVRCGRYDALRHGAPLEADAVKGCVLVS